MQLHVRRNVTPADGAALAGTARREGSIRYGASRYSPAGRRNCRRRCQRSSLCLRLFRPPSRPCPSGDSGRSRAAWHLLDRSLRALGAYFDGRCDRAGQAAGRTAPRTGCPVCSSLRTTGVETVCHVITRLELGGAQEVALYAVSHLDRTRFRPVLVAGPGGMLTEEARRLPGVQTIIVPSLGRRIHAWSDLIALLNLIRLFRRLRPAIVHTHSSKAGVLGRWAAWFARVPIIIHTVHGYGITPGQPAWLRR